MLGVLALQVRQARLVEARVAVGFFERLRVRLKRENGRARQTRIIHHGHELVLRQNSPDLIVLDQYDVERVLVDLESLTYELFQVINRFVRLDREVVEYAALRRIEWNPEELFLNKADLWDGQ